MQFECLTPESSFIGTKAFFGTYGEKKCFLNIVRVTLADSHLFKLLGSFLKKLHKFMWM